MFRKKSLTIALIVSLLAISAPLPQYSSAQAAAPVNFPMTITSYDERALLLYDFTRGLEGLSGTQALSRVPPLSSGVYQETDPGGTDRHRTPEDEYNYVLSHIKNSLGNEEGYETFARWRSMDRGVSEQQALNDLYQRNPDGRFIYDPIHGMLWEEGFVHRDLGRGGGNGFSFFQVISFIVTVALIVYAPTIAVELNLEEASAVSGVLSDTGFGTFGTELGGDLAAETIKLGEVIGENATYLVNVPILNPLIPLGGVLSSGVLKEKSNDGNPNLSSPPPISCLPFSPSPSTISLGQSSALSWNCSGANSCSIDNGVGSVNPSSGSKNVSPSQTTTYNLSCSGSAGSKSYPATLTVNQPPLCTFSASPSRIIPPQSSSLLWSCQNANSCSLDNGIGAVAVSGSKNVSPSQTTTYSLSCSGIGGASSFQSTVTVTDFNIREVGPGN